MLTYVAPEEAGFVPDRLQYAYDFLQEAVDHGKLPGAALLAARRGRAVAPFACGRLGPESDQPPITPETIFLVASITKPFTAAAVMMLVERGKLLLSDRVSSIVPEFGNRGKEDVRVRHLLTHTSGLPDMLPENLDLRRQHAPLDEFVRRIYELELDFEPGTRIQYQSTGMAILGEIVARLAGKPLPDFLREAVFMPLRMQDTGLGAQGLDETRIAHVNVPAEQRKTDWGWNQPYWRNLAVPWGGLFTTVTDLYRFARLFLNGGECDGVRLLSPASVAEMIRDQTGPMMRLTTDDYRRLIWGQTWGLGWTIVGQRMPEERRTFFGDIPSPRTFGHGGATGTALWLDPESEVICILLTTEPTALSSGLAGRCSNLVAAAAT